ncbi:MAG: amidohydrolase [Bacteroidota bacterium]
MKRSHALVLALAAAAALLVMLLFPGESLPDLLLVNGVVYTGDAAGPRAGALAIREGKILEVGSTGDLEARFPDAPRLDAGGKAVVPGFTDSHGHLEGLGAALAGLDLTGASSPADIQHLVGGAARSAGAGAWVRGRGWDQNRWNPPLFPTAAILDSVSGKVPVYLKRVDGHAVWVNSRAMELAGLDRRTPDPQGGRILRDREGNPTGVFVDRAVDLLENHLPEVSRGERAGAVLRGAAACARAGLTGVHDMGVDAEGISLYRELAGGGRLPIRVYAVLDGEDTSWVRRAAGGPLVDEGGRLTVRAVKLYADGALGSRGAALLEPYNDEPLHRGLTLVSSDRIVGAARTAIRSGFQMCVHAIGDRANALVLDAYAEAFRLEGANGGALRFRVEHAQVLAGPDIGRFARLGVIPSMQPVHCTSDMGWVEDRVGSQRARTSYAWRSLLDAGCVIPAGSDFPVESPDPFAGFHAAITRQDPGGNPPGGWHPEQRMTREEALKAFTLWGAWAAFEEDRRGILAPGMDADLLVLSRDIMRCPAREIPGTAAHLTMVGGVIAWTDSTLRVTRGGGDAPR